jgi:hypothetical protein
MVSVIGDRIAQVIREGPAAEVRRVLLRLEPAPAFVEYGAVAVRHVDVMGSGRFFYADPPRRRRVQLVTGAPPSGKALYSALTALGLPRRIARVVLRDRRRKRPAPDCTSLHRPTGITTEVYTFRHQGSAARDTYAVVERDGDAPPTSLALVTPRTGPLLLRLHRPPFRPAQGNVPIEAKLLFEGRRARVAFYKSWPLVADVRAAVASCAGLDRGRLRDRYGVFVVSAR